VLGRDCRLINVDFGTEPYLVKLGNHVSVTKSHFVTHDGGVWVFRSEQPDVDYFGRICIGNNVFIGLGSILLPGVTIGDNVVIGAGSVVARDIPSNCVAVGVPARPVRSLEKYADKVSAGGFETKSLSPRKKRKYLLERFSAHLEQDAAS
jgi:acetyltransferase-like isoleucine patch superfamily enzyme